MNDNTGISYVLEITPTKGEVLRFGKEKNSDVTNVNFKIEAVGDNLKRHSDSLVVTLHIEGKFISSTQKETLDLLKWAKQTKKEEVYRKVVVEIYQDEELYRQYNIPEMFVTNYEENLDRFILDLRQHTDYVDDMDVFMG